MSWLLVSPCGFLGCLFTGTLPGGRLGMANWEGSIYFSFFFIIGVFGWKEALSPLTPQGDGFCKCALLEKRASKRSKQTAVFNIVGGNATKIGVSEIFFIKTQWSRTVYVFPFLFTFSDSEISCCTCLLGGPNKEAAYLQPKHGNRCVQKWDACMRSTMGGPMLRNMSAPFLNALDDKQQVVIPERVCVGKPGVTVPQWWHKVRQQKKIESLKTENTPKLNITAYTYMYVHIYVCIYIYT